MFYNDLKVQIVRETVDLKHTNPEYIITYMTLSQVIMRNRRHIENWLEKMILHEVIFVQAHNLERCYGAVS